MYESDDIIKYLVGKYGVCGFYYQCPIYHFIVILVYLYHNQF